MSIFLVVILILLILGCRNEQSSYCGRSVSEHAVMDQPHPVELQVPGTFIGLNPRGWGPLILQPCQCRACVRIRAFNEGRLAKEADR